MKHPDEYFLFSPKMLNSYEIYQLSDHDFVRLFRERLDGKENIFSEFIRGPFYRPQAREWKEIRTRIFKRDDYTCQYCGERGGKLECDHIVPVSRGGTSDDDNLATACHPCNRSKGGKNLEDWQSG